MSEELIGKIKNLQRNDEKAKIQWGAYADAEGERIRDPAKHTDAFLQKFLDEYAAGKQWEVQRDGSQEQLIELIKFGQRTSRNWRNAWNAYCEIHSEGKTDPARKDKKFMIGFMECMAEASMSPMAVPTKGGGGMGMGGKGWGDDGWGGGKGGWGGDWGMGMGGMGMGGMGMDGMVMVPIGSMGMGGMGMGGGWGKADGGWDDWGGKGKKGGGMKGGKGKGKFY
eukprot:TRINITY_DN19790_c0_g1_i1.p1 TRINITY_DN19790_c0_g1~~TRINITY_DN19790_c0_g1_i1.p1  ORF type:complete len:224 (+),score=68.32 TRINITY_DN19790_c0_g1_i1:71-742(+)